MSHQVIGALLLGFTMKWAIKKPMNKCICWGCTHRWLNFTPVSAGLTITCVRDRHQTAADGVPSLENHQTLQKCSELMQGKQKSPPLPHIYWSLTWAKAQYERGSHGGPLLLQAGAHQILGGIQNSGTAEWEWFCIQCSMPSQRHWLTNWLVQPTWALFSPYTFSISGFS